MIAITRIDLSNAISHLNTIPNSMEMITMSIVKQFVGLHIGGSYESLLESIQLYQQGYNHFQIMLGPGKSLKLDNVTIGNVKGILEKYPDIIYHVHLALPVTAAGDKNDRPWKATLRYAVEASHHCNILGIRNMVLHTGSNPHGIQSAYSNLMEFCWRFLMVTEGHNTVLCLENDVGSKKGTRMGHVPLLMKVVKEIGHPRIRLCLDTNHAWGNNWKFDIENMNHVTKALEYTALVHLNSIPEECQKGGHVDRHSFTLLEEAHHCDPTFLANIAKLASSRVINPLNSGL